VQAADGLRRLAGKGDVDAVLRQAGVELGRLELARPRLDEAFERLARLVGGLADLPALLWRQLRDAAQEVRQLGLAAEVPDPELPSGRPVRSAPTTSVPCPGPRSASPPWATSATRGAGSCLTLATRATGTAKIAPIDARTALGPKGSAVSGPIATQLAPNAAALRKTVPTLPGSCTPHSATHSGPVGALQRCS
jgi:hypothetical protein